ncbi:MAG: CGNR zinc finger domain-containing protein [Pseudonocardia sp.]|nr:CGNR zinc finger domain-containing protein [Pseudonocardia sp.]
MNFGSHTNEVVAATAALINVATPGERRGRRYSVPAGDELTTAIGEALRLARRETPIPSASRVPAFVDLAAAARPVFELIDGERFDDAAQTVNGLLARYQPMPYLERHDGQPWHLHFPGRAASDRSDWGGGISVGLATVLGSDHADRLGVCSAPACDRVFVDASRNGTRRFCSTACQNRVKAATHRARSK